MRSYRRTEHFRPGMSIEWEGDVSTIPHGWLGELGQLLNIADYPRLAPIVGTVHGGDGVTTFQLADTRDRVTVGAGTGYARGAKGGADSRTTNNYTLTVAQTPVHAHDFRVYNDIAASTTHSPSYTLGESNSGFNTIATTPNTSLHPDSITGAGGGGAHNHGSVDVRQPYLARYKIIKY